MKRTLDVAMRVPSNKLVFASKENESQTDAHAFTLVPLGHTAVLDRKVAAFGPYPPHGRFGFMAFSANSAKRKVRFL